MDAKSVSGASGSLKSGQGAAAGWAGGATVPDIEGRQFDVDHAAEDVLEGLWGCIRVCNCEWLELFGLRVR